MTLIHAMQYGSGTGDISLRSWCREFTEVVFQPAYSDYEILLNAGNTDGWNKVVGLLTEPGDLILCEAHTYPSAQALWIPLGCEAVPVGMDGEGMRSDDLARTLDGWDAEHPGAKKPHLLYLVPAGSNPSGSTMSGQRKKAIYGVCVKHDIIICEDDPYYFLQYPEHQVGKVFEPKESTSTSDYLSSLSPSFLHYDYQGRVIRLDTFSKTLSPGNRLGNFIANPVFIERLLRATEVETQAPSGWSQIVISNLLHNWAIDGYLLWLSCLRDQYRARRDWMSDAIARNFDVKDATSLMCPLKGAEGLVVFAKGSDKAIMSFVPPSAGMVIWSRFYLYNSPQFLKIASQSSVEDPEAEFSNYIWGKLAKALVLLTPGSYYIPWQGEEKTTTKARGAEEGIGYFRLAFSMTSRWQMDTGVERMAKVLKECWE